MMDTKEWNYKKLSKYSVIYQNPKSEFTDLRCATVLAQSIDEAIFKIKTENMDFGLEIISVDLSEDDINKRIFIQSKNDKKDSYKCLLVEFKSYYTDDGPYTMLLDLDDIKIVDDNYLAFKILKMSNSAEEASKNCEDEDELQEELFIIDNDYFSVEEVCDQDIFTNKEILTFETKEEMNLWFELNFNN